MFSLVVLVLAVAAGVSANCDGNYCNRPYVHYNDLGCTAVYANSSDCCPSHFTCPNLLEERSPDKCYLKGHSFNKGDHIPQNLVSSCKVNCRCMKEDEDIQCDRVDCPNFVVSYVNDGCYYSYKPGQCCPDKKICPPYENIAQCVVNGETYYEGNRIASENKNFVCECKPGFAGEFVPPFCTEVTKCGIEEYYHSEDVRNKCAPVFYGPGGCPIEWECFQDGDVVVPNIEGTTSEQKCTYGNMKLNIGDKLVLKSTRSRSKADCKCDIPPLVSCIQKPRHY